MKPISARTIYAIGIAISSCCMHCVIVPSDKQAYEQMMATQPRQPRQCDRRVTAAERKVFQQQQALAEQIYIRNITAELKKQTEERVAFVVERRQTIKIARVRLAQENRTSFLQVPVTQNNDREEPVGPDFARSS